MADMAAFIGVASQYIKSKVGKKGVGGAPKVAPLHQKVEGTQVNKSNKVKFYVNRYSLNEIGQQTGMLFAFLSAPRNGLTMCHPWIKCRDFLHDAVRAMLTKTNCSIFGFNYGPEKKGCAPLDLRRMRMMVTQQTVRKSTSTQVVADFDMKMRYAKKLVNYYEKAAGKGLTKLSRHNQDGVNFWIFNGPAFWMKSPALVSMFTFLVRLGDKKIDFKTDKDLIKAYKDLMKKGNDNDCGYLNSVGKHLLSVATKADDVLIKGKRFDEDYFTGVEIGTFHNQAGVMSLCDGSYINNKKHTAIKK